MEINKMPSGVYVRTEENRRNISRVKKEYMNRLDVKTRNSQAQKDAWAKPEIRQKFLTARKLSQSRPDVRVKLSISGKEAQNRSEVKRKRLETFSKPEVLARISEASKQAWARSGVRQKHIDAWNNKSNEEKEKILSKIFRSTGMGPNKTEIILSNIIEDIKSNDFKYVGDFQVWIGGKCPDWININGKKQVIEFFGDYWHGEDRRSRKYKDFKTNEEHVLDRIEYYKKYGFDCLIIWEKDLSDTKDVIKRIEQF